MPDYPSILTTGLPNLDKILKGVAAGDNIVWRVDSIEDYLPFVEPYCRIPEEHDVDFIYLRFAQHKELVGENERITKYQLHPENGFEPLISEIFSIIEKHGFGAYYLFDCLSELAVDWYSDRMLGNFFRLTCPYLFEYKTVTYFALLKNYHSSHAIDKIHNTAQVVLDVYRNNDMLYIHPQKVFERYSNTLYMLHVWHNDDFHPVTKSAEVTEILAHVPQPWLDFTIKRPGVWARIFEEAQTSLNGALVGKRPFFETEYYFQKLLRMAFTRDPKLSTLAEKYLRLEDLLMIKKRMIGTGLIGGKSAGMLLARAILCNHNRRWLSKLEEHDSFFIGSDFFYTYMVENDCWWVLRKQRDTATILKGAEEARKKMMVGNFPEDIRNQFQEILDYFGQSPLIVRSSSLLEDNYGNAFSGKYESVFCTNQGTPEERLESFMSAVRTVYASTMSQEALLYRMHRGLLEHDEQMGLLVQRVSGGIFGNLFFPKVAGVGFSYNPYVWNKDIDPKVGVLRLVVGLGTRAVDRCDDDYTRVVALNAPNLRPESNFDEVRKYTQHRVDVLDLTKNTHSSLQFEDVAQSSDTLRLDIIASRDLELERRARENNLKNVFSWVITFEKLFQEYEFVDDMRELLQTLQEAYGCPVDVEFTANFMEDGSYRINLVQCRPFQVKGESKHIQLPKDIGSKRVLLKTQGPIIGPSLAVRIDRLIYVVPKFYSELNMNDRYSVARLIGDLTHQGKDCLPEQQMLIGPGRWGTTTPALGVPVSFAHINTVTVLCELALMREGIVPDISLGTHFFNDLVEADILYLAVSPSQAENVFNEEFLLERPNQLTSLLPEAVRWEDIVHVIDTGCGETGEPIMINMNSMKQLGICYFE